ncbi:hypothetical protein [Burkholderia pseudomultivorans]|uniref:hypothetical protein n=1 Tax=Burkholderia pseudomultivorans TaxID=1207504 RepID=UPI000B282754|nr:hypothetical protein [Burkholderia pseudomultivorans]
MDENQFTQFTAKKKLIFIRVVTPLAAAAALRGHRRAPRSPDARGFDTKWARAPHATSRLMRVFPNTPIPYNPSA